MQRQAIADSRPAVGCGHGADRLAHAASDLSCENQSGGQPARFVSFGSANDGFHMTADLFAEAPGPLRETMGEGAVLLRGKALPLEDEVIAALAAITARAPFRNMVTPGGFVMSVAMTNCGAAGWVTDRKGYRYDRNDPETGKPWPDMPDSFLRLAAGAAAEADYQDFTPDACLINRYEPGARLSLHQDRNERDFAEPIVSVSLGLPAVFSSGA